MIGLHHLAYDSPSGTTSAVVVPGWGANILGFSYRAEGWQWPVPVLEAVDLATLALAPSSYGAPLLAPTPGRVGQNQNGRFRWRGQDHTISPTRHGWLRGAVWQIDNASTSHIACTANFAPDSAKCSLPFDFTARHDVRIGEASILSRVSLTNTGDIDLPLDVGWHPYLHREGPCRVMIPASMLWELNTMPEPTPTGTLLEATGDIDFRMGKDVHGAHWDHVFCDLEADANGWADNWVESVETIALKGGRAETLTFRRHVRINSQPADAGTAAVRNMQLFTPPGRNAISLEPLSSVPDALNLSDLGVPEARPNVVRPGQTSAFEMEMAITTPGA
ncbi:MAG: aldose 1-epimerase [Pseudomonadota bacterium]